MPKFSVFVGTTFDGYVEIVASSQEEAIKLAKEKLLNNEINPIQDFSPWTEVHFAEEIENA
jgi:hypothetical protein